MIEAANTPYARHFLTLLERFTGNQPDALAQMRKQIASEVEVYRNNLVRAEQQLDAIDALLALGQDDVRTEATEPLFALGPAEQARGPEGWHLPPARPTTPSLRQAILLVLDNHDGIVERDALFNDLLARGWGPGGRTPRNTLKSRLWELEKKGQVELDGDTVRLLKREEVPAV